MSLRRHNGSTVLASVRKSQTPMTYSSKRTYVAEYVIGPHKRPRRLLHTRRSNSIMSSAPKSQLWQHSAGIRFAPRTDLSPQYPVLDTSRFIHTQSMDSSSIQNPKPVLEEFSDDEEFDRSASEWFDQQDALTLALSPATDAEVTQAAQTVTKEPSGVIAEDEISHAPIIDFLLPVTSLAYNIDKDLFEAARQSKEGTPESYWSYTMYHHLQEDGSTQKVKVHYCTSKQTMEHVCKKYFMNEKIIGFDLEWMPFARRSSGPRANVSLIQIASPSRIGLFHVGLFLKDDFVAPSFKKIMEDESVAKVGVAISADCTRLKRYLGVDSKGIFELSHLYKLVKHSKDGKLDLINKVSVSLAIQVQDCLGLPLYKGQSVRSSNWMVPLTDRQITYSASDAYAGVQLYHVLEAEREKLDPCPPRPEFAEKGKPIRFLAPEEADEETDLSEESSVEADAALEADATADPEAPDVIEVPEPAMASVKPAPQDRDSRITAAELELQEYRSQKQKHLNVSPSALRAYYIWHANADLTPESVAKLLRDPPLKTNTVVSYILDAIAQERLPFSKTRLRSEVLTFLAPNVQLGPKYMSIIQETQDLGGTSQVET